LRLSNFKIFVVSKNIFNFFLIYDTLLLMYISIFIECNLSILITIIFKYLYVSQPTIQLIIVYKPMF